jgi:hypothetical protein
MLVVGGRAKAEIARAVGATVVHARGVMDEGKLQAVGTGGWPPGAEGADIGVRMSALV